MAESKRKTSAKAGGANTEQTDQPQAPEPGTGRPGDSGPGTGVDAPADKAEGRYPATVVGDDNDPLAPPKDAATQTEPEAGQTMSSTDQVYAETGGRTIAGEDHVSLVDGDGNTVDVGSLFDGGDGSKGSVTVTKRVYEEFTYPNTTETARRLLFTEGQRVPRAQADRVKAAVSAPKPGTSNPGKGSGQGSGDDA